MTWVIAGIVGAVCLGIGCAVGIVLMAVLQVSHYQRGGGSDG